MDMIIRKSDDFEITGDGQAAAWARADWQTLKVVSPGQTGYATRAKVLYSTRGLYFLFDNEDRRLTCTMTQDFQNIFQEDVVEIFLWPNEAQDLYFEYELSPLGVELPEIVPNWNGTYHGWRPWHYEGDRLTRRATTTRGGPKASMAAVDGWMAEFFIPFALLRGLGNTPPASGMRWRANLFRIDYDNASPIHWAWCEKTGTNFHDFRNFGAIVFE